MDPSPEQISALAEQLSQLARNLSTEQDPKARRMQTSNLVMAAKKTVSTLQEPMETLTDQITLVNLTPLLLNRHMLIPLQPDLLHLSSPRAHGTRCLRTSPSSGLYNCQGTRAESTV
jgi:hypothetical protein